ncbi:MAG: right-handed parallel beta-helix repeat-containing protein [Deltaproteobacteria bacterium]|nr:right-handed parallel beta-helix repeat-containing protein [Deltaproteobacteria bacterium]
MACTHPDSQLSGNVTLDGGCVYEQSFVIKESNTTLDCNGAQIVGTDAYLVTVRGEIDGVTVKNCYLRGGKGIAVRPPGRLDGETDEQLRQRSPKNVVLTNLHVTESANVGVYFHHHVVGATIQDSIIVDNSSAGVYLSPYGQGSQILNNLIKDNGHVKEDGSPRIGWYRREGVAVDASSQHLIERNDFDHNALGGVLLYKNCWEHAATDPKSTPRTEHAHSNVIRGNTFARMPFGVWVAARQSRDLDLMECGDSTPYANPIWIATVFHPSYSSYSSAYADFYLPWISVWPDFAENNTIVDNRFEEIGRGGIRIEDDSTTVTGNLFLGDFDYVFVGAPFRARLDGHPVLDTVIADNSFANPVATLFADHLALIPDEHLGTQLSNNLRACASPWGGWLRHGEQILAYRPDGAAPGGCAEQVRTCNDGVLDGDYTDEECVPAPPEEQEPDAGVETADAGEEPDGGTSAEPEVPTTDAPTGTTAGGCRAADHPGGRGSAASLVLAALLLGIRARARRSPSTGLS